MGGFRWGSQEGVSGMNDRPPLSSLNGPLRRTLAHLGLTDIDVLLQLIKDWDELLDAPWAGVSAPVMLIEKELTVQTESQSSVGVLRYGTSDAVRKINEAMGEGTVESVRVIGPPR